jgi:hypothetical protein
MESGQTGFKIGWQGFPRRRKAPTVKLYISEHFSAKCVTRRGCSCHPQFKFILLSLVTTQCTTFLIGINKKITYSTMIYGSPTDPQGWGLVLYHHIMSPTDHSSFQHLANYLSAGSRLSAIEFLCPLFHDIRIQQRFTGVRPTPGLALL